MENHPGLFSWLHRDNLHSRSKGLFAQLLKDTLKGSMG